MTNMLDSCCCCARAKYMLSYHNCRAHRKRRSSVLSKTGLACHGGLAATKDPDLQRLVRFGGLSTFSAPVVSYTHVTLPTIHRLYAAVAPPSPHTTNAPLEPVYHPPTHIL